MSDARRFFWLGGPSFLPGLLFFAGVFCEERRSGKGLFSFRPFVFSWRGVLRRVLFFFRASSGGFDLILSVGLD